MFFDRDDAGHDAEVEPVAHSEIAIALDLPRGRGGAHFADFDPPIRCDFGPCIGAPVFGRDSGVRKFKCELAFRILARCF